MVSADTCICCGEIVPEGRQICGACERIVNEFNKLGNPGPVITPDELRLILERSKQTENKKIKFRIMPGRMNGKRILEKLLERR